MSNRRKKSRAKRTYRRRTERFATSPYGSKCVFCGSEDVTVHHVVFQRFAPELINDADNHVPMCSKCQHTYHFLTDKLLDYLKLNTGQIHMHEIREKLPIQPPVQPPIPPPVQTTSPSFTISGGVVTINL